jgi:glycosyltransferase involved in cell wall biosynthesis
MAKAAALQQRPIAGGAVVRSLIVPVYRNAENIEDLVAALRLLDAEVGGMEVVFVVDGSPDDSGAMLLTQRPGFGFASQVIFHSRNFGSFTAIRTGMAHARGDVIAVMAADLQEPPELVAAFFSKLEKDECDVVFGKRCGRRDGVMSDCASGMYWALYRRLVLRDMPRGGVDIFACNRKVAESVLRIEEPNSSLVAQLFWVGFRRGYVDYERRARAKGKSGWSFSRKLRYMLDSIVSFTDLPILVVLWLGLLGCAGSLLFGLCVLVARLLNMIDVPGYTAVVLLITFSVSLLVAVQGILGLYLWRTFENTKRRPMGLVSHVVAD